MSTDAPADRRTAPAPLAFVAGATGYVGREVVAQLVRAGIPTIAHVRPDSPRLAEWWTLFTRMGAEPDATPWEVPALEAVLHSRKPTMIFCLVGTTRTRMQALSREGRDPDAASYEAVDYGLTAKLAEAAVLAGHAPRFVYLSAIGAGPGAKGAYMRWRTRAEQAVRASGLPYLVVRPAIITGPDREEDRRGERIANRALDGALSLGRALGWAGPWRRYRSIDAEGLARAMIDLARVPDAPSRVVERGDLDDGPAR